jgi:hypothetical protein
MQGEIRCLPRERRCGRVAQLSKIVTLVSSRSEAIKRRTSICAKKSRTRTSGSTSRLGDQSGGLRRGGSPPTARPSCGRMPESAASSREMARMAAKSAHDAFGARAAPAYDKRGPSVALRCPDHISFDSTAPYRRGGRAPEWANKIDPGAGTRRFNPRGSVSSLWPQPSTDTRLKRRLTGYLPPSALQSGVSRDGRPIARKASGVMPSVWLTLSTRPTILFDSVPSAFAVTSLMKTEPVA